MLPPTPAVMSNRARNSVSRTGQAKETSGERSFGRGVKRGSASVAAYPALFKAHVAIPKSAIPPLEPSPSSGRAPLTHSRTDVPDVALNRGNAHFVPPRARRRGINLKRDSERLSSDLLKERVVAAGSPPGPVFAGAP
jgi:hypothetical protein